MALPLPKPKALLADKGCDSDRFHGNLLMRGILPIIPPRSSRKDPVHPDYRRYKDRVERRIESATCINVVGNQIWLDIAGMHR